MISRNSGTISHDESLWSPVLLSIICQMPRMPPGESGTIKLFAGLVRIPDVAFASWDRLPDRKRPKEPIPLLAPDLGQAELQIANAQIGLEGARNLTKPQVDLVGIMQNNGLAGAVNPLAPNSSVAITGGYGNALEQVLSRNYPTYGAGIQVTLPIHNRIAEADLARDELQVKQSELRLRQLQNQAPWVCRRRKPFSTNRSRQRAK